MITNEKDESDMLARFTELAPREWALGMSGGLKFCGLPTGSAAIWFYPDEATGETVFNDRASAEALIFLWDYLEGRGFILHLHQCDGHRGYLAKLYWRDKHWVCRRSNGKTRIEAVIRACISLWEADHDAPEKGIGSNQEPPPQAARLRQEQEQKGDSSGPQRPQEPNER